MKKLTVLFLVLMASLCIASTSFADEGCEGFTRDINRSAIGSQSTLGCGRLLFYNRSDGGPDLPFFDELFSDFCKWDWWNI